MEIRKQHLAYFSATNNTRNVVRRIGLGLGLSMGEEYNFAGGSTKGSMEASLSSTELLVVGVPSYFGRVPSLVVPHLSRFRGNNSPAIIVCTYGNRDYEDTLLEMKDILSSNGFRIVAAGAFVATHSIFPQVAAHRPDEDDLQQQDDFAAHCASILEGWNSEVDSARLSVRGNRPYRGIGKIPFRPIGNRKCNDCGTCARLCPTGAIAEDSPRKTNKEKCIACGRCIALCPQGARSYGGLIYQIGRRKFVKAHQSSQPNVLSYVE